MKRKLIAVLISALMIVTMLPAIAMAQSDVISSYTPTVSFRETSLTGDTADYAGTYKELGIGFNAETNTVTIPTGEIAYSDLMKHGDNYYVGLAFAKPEGATQVKITSDLAQYPAPISLEQDGKSVVNG
ncbi:MAG: hypothetical protein VB082_09805, partial [Christensenella sp.]|nr:hypothetical protein [Christensenella sp.]